MPKAFFYLTHTLYAKPLIPLMVRLAEAGYSIYASKNKFDFIKYKPVMFGGMPIQNRFVNKSSFDYAAKTIGYQDEWKLIKDRVRFVFRAPLRECDIVIGTTKNLDRLNILKERRPSKMVIAIGYQHMPFVVSLNGSFKNRNLPAVCIDTFMKPNLFSDMHRFYDYVSGFQVSFRSFSYLEKVYNDYYKHAAFLEKEDKTKRYALVFHPGGYRGVITNPGETKKVSYEKQRAFFITICKPILSAGLIPIIKIHPLAARFHFKEDVVEILDGLSKEDKDFAKIVVEDGSYYKYVYDCDAIVGFGSSSIYELFSIRARNIIICNFFGKTRSSRFSFMDGIFINSQKEYNDFWRRDREGRFLNAYKRNKFLNDIYESYAGLFSEDITGQILNDIGLV